MTCNEHQRDLSLWPAVSIRLAHLGQVNNIVELSDGTLVSCSLDFNIKRWSTHGQLLNTYVGHSGNVMDSIELDDNTFVSGSWDRTMKVWNKTTGECLHTFQSSGVSSLLRLHNTNSFLCGNQAGTIDERRAFGNYEVLHTYNIHSVNCMCAMSNSTVVVSGTVFDLLKVWDMNSRTLIYNLKGHTSIIWRVIELKRDDNKQIVASCSSDETVRIWNIATGECLQVLKGHKDSIKGLVELLDGTLLSASWDKTIRAWNKRGECVSTSVLQLQISCMAGTRDGCIAIGSVGGAIEVIKTWMSEFGCSLVNLCCKLISLNHTKFDMVALKQYLPKELYDHVIKNVKRHQ
eukprot:TRINITY_DN261_c0_g2_i1.p1 TRINITY_DN261_c0_g2~~TRINITY_DN261_c0_g2_i1.p1  ORF type:complete len:347 (-),score=62.97 TRINITY_DN261_c0_g2_i1:46-1086(-)